MGILVTDEEPARARDEELAELLRSCCEPGRRESDAPDYDDPERNAEWM